MAVVVTFIEQIDAVDVKTLATISIDFGYPINTGGGSTDVNATNVGAAIDNFTVENAPAKTQYVALGGKKKTLISKLIDLFKIDFDAIYAVIGHNHSGTYANYSGAEILLSDDTIWIADVDAAVEAQNARRASYDEYDNRIPETYATKEELSAKQDSADILLQTVDTTIIGAINELKARVDENPRKLSFTNIQDLVTAFNGYAIDLYNIGQDAFIAQLQYSDAWIYGKVGVSVPYTYTTDDDFDTALQSGVQIGYYILQPIEFKTNLENYYTKTEIDLLELGDLNNVDLTESKTTPVDADAVLLQDSEDSYIWKRITWANFKAALKTFFDTIYLAIVTTDNTLTGTGTPASVLSNNMFNWRAKYGCELFTDLSGAIDVFDHWYYRTGNNTSLVQNGTNVDGRVGIQSLTTLASATNRTYFTGGISAPAKYPINGSVTSFRVGLMIPTLSDGTTERFCIKAGFCGDNEAATVSQNNGSYFLYDEKNTSGRGASTQWKCISANGNVVTGTNNASGVTVGAGTWYDLMVVVDTANTNAKFYINGALVDTHTANIFTGAVSFSILLQKSDGTTARLLNVDYFGIKSVFNTQRF